MGSEILLPESQDEAPASTPEVEFALVLSRMIDSVRNDPEHLRATIYELARHKFREQTAFESLEDRRRLKKALEAAIQGVEAFVKKNDMRLDVLPAPEAAQRLRVEGPPAREAPFEPPPTVIQVESSNFASRRSAFRFAHPLRFAVLLAIALVAVLAITRREMVRNAADRVATFLSSTRPAPAQVALTPVVPAAVPVPERSATLPATYGIYAVSDEKLYELEMLPGRAPDIRVAVSAAIKTPSRTVLPDGHLKFIVYRRDSATNAADRAEVRIVAKVERETGFEPTGKAVVSNIDDTWIIRNISIPFRTAPNKDSPDMYEIQSENPDSALTPGRYVLVLRGQAYDFSVAGAVLDPRQCLERLAATNGQFYSGCQKP